MLWVVLITAVVLAGATEAAAQQPPRPEIIAKNLAQNGPRAIARGERTRESFTITYAQEPGK